MFKYQKKHFRHVINQPFFNSVDVRYAYLVVKIDKTVTYMTLNLIRYAKV